MIFVTPTSNARAAKDYFERALSPSDYYLRDAQEQAGQWHGLGAQLLDLSGEVKKDQFFRLCDNEHPVTGERLTARTKDSRRIFYDFTFDAPKSVSVAYEVGGDERILDAFRGSVQETMSEMEADMMARVRGGGEDADRRTSNMVWAEFVHRTTRPVDGVPDPQLHCHAVTFNATFDPVEERWKAAQFGNIVRDKGYYQAAFHARLAGHLRELGYGIERDGNSFRLAGIDRSSCDRFSRRSAIIEEEADRLGITSAKAKGELGRRTREAKAEGGLISELREDWRARLTDSERQAIAAARAGRETTTANAVQAMDFALAHCFERESVVPEKKLVAQALIHGVGKSSVRDIWGETARSGVIRREVDGQRYATTQDVYREELAVVAFVRDGRGKYRKLGGISDPALDPGLSAEQRDAALTILRSRDAVTELRGSAGTGKTTMMRATVNAIEEGGKRVFAFAPSAKAADVLKSEDFGDAATVERLLVDKEMQKRIHGQVLWVDESGLLSVKDMKRLLDVAGEQGARVILSGDIKQHSAVARGDALRLLEEEAGMKYAELKQVRRQIPDDYRAAVTAISEGETRRKDGRTGLETGIEQLGRMGAIVELEGEERYRRIAADYVEATGQTGRDGKHKTALVVSPTHAEGRCVTEEIRTELKAAGRLKAAEREFTVLKALGLTEAQRRDAGSFQAGEVIQFHQNAKGFKRGERVTVTQADAGGVQVLRADGTVTALPLSEARKFQVYETEQLALAAGDRVRITMNGYSREVKRGAKLAKSRLNNGDAFEVEGFTPGGDIRLTNGFVVPKDYGGLTHGYVVTSHASQGATVNHVLVALGSESLVAANRQQFYVSVSRGRDSVRLYTDDKEAMLESVKADAARPSATQLMKEAKPARTHRANALHRLAAIQRIQRVYHAVRERVAAIGERFRNRQDRQEISLG